MVPKAAYPPFGENHYNLGYRDGSVSVFHFSEGVSLTGSLMHSINTALERLYIFFPLN